MLTMCFLVQDTLQGQIAQDSESIAQLKHQLEEQEASRADEKVMSTPQNLKHPVLLNEYLHTDPAETLHTHRKNGFCAPASNVSLPSVLPGKACEGHHSAQ